MQKRLFWSVFRYIASLIALFALIGAVFVWWAVGDTLPTFSKLPVEEAKGNIKAPAPPEHLRVVTYNIGHGQGVKENAWDYRDDKTTRHQLGMVADAIANMNADIVMLQEVDIDSHRTFRINQMEVIREKTKHPYAACANMWEKNYLPYPYWPPAHHLGYMRAANCILSRFPLKNQERVIFDKPKNNPFFYSLGYIDRGIERVDVEIGSETLAILNIHLEAWDKATREEQVKVLADYIDNIELPLILGGDFNTVPSNAPKKSGFIDDPHVNYQEEKTFPWLFAHTKNIKRPVLSAPDNTAFELFTFPSNEPDRLLDHIFIFGSTLSYVDYRVVKEAGLASDHLPVMAIINYRSLNQH